MTNGMIRTALAAATLTAGVAAQVSMTPLAPAPLEPFQRLHLSERYYAEGAAFGDFDRNGVRDIVSGPWWYEGPSFKTRHKIHPARAFPIGGYADKFFAWADDVNGDGFDDVVTVGFPGTAALWYENPRAKGPLWKRHVVFPFVDMESPAFTDIDRDGKRELVFAFGGKIGYAKRDASNASKAWRFHPLTPKQSWSAFTHGLGVGDVDGDGRADVLTSLGWWKQPASLAGDPVWQANGFLFGLGGSQMFAYDVDGDGDNDVVTSIVAHGYGLSWFEHVKRNGRITFVEHQILPKVPSRRVPVQFSQLHALDVADMNGDGLLDIVTGKTFWAHLGTDPGAREPAVLYWFRLERRGGARFVPEIIDADSGVGRQVMAGDVNGDGKTDVVVGNKKGTFVFLRS